MYQKGVFDPKTKLDKNEGPSINDVGKMWPFLTFDPPPPPASAYFGLLQAKINSSIRIWQTPPHFGADVLYRWPLRNW